MEIAKMTSKGQLTIPKEIRKRLGLNTGDKVLFVEKDGMYTIMKEGDIKVVSTFGSEKIASVVASMAIENLDVDEEMLTYAKQRINGKVSYEERMREIEKKYMREVHD